MEDLNSSDDIKELVDNKLDEELFYSLADLKNTHSLSRTSGIPKKYTNTNSLGTDAYENCVSDIVHNNDTKGSSNNSFIHMTGQSTLSTPFSLSPLLSVNTCVKTSKNCKHACLVASNDSDEQYSLADVAKKHGKVSKLNEGCKNLYDSFSGFKKDADELNHDISEQIRQSFEDLTVKAVDSFKSESNVNSDRKMRKKIHHGLAASSGGFYNISKSSSYSVVINEHMKLESDHSVSDLDDELSYSLADLAKQHLPVENLVKEEIVFTADQVFGVEQFLGRDLACKSSSDIEKSVMCLPVKSKKFLYQQHSEITSSTSSANDLTGDKNEQQYFVMDNYKSESDSDDELSYSLADLAKQHLSVENLEKEDVLLTADQVFGGAEKFSGRFLGCKSSSSVERNLTCLSVKSEKFMYQQCNEVTSNTSSASDLTGDKNVQEYFVMHSHSLPNLPSGHTFRNVDKELDILCSSYDRAKSRFNYHVTGGIRKGGQTYDTHNSLSKSDISATESSRNCSESSDLLMDELDGLWFSEIYPSSLTTQKAVIVQSDSKASNKHKTDSNLDWDIDLSSALKSVDLNPSNMCEVTDNIEDDIDNWTLPVVVQTLSPKPVEDCLLDSSVLLKTHLVLRTKCSSFGKVICKKWKMRRKPYIKVKSLQTSVKRFKFDTLSPDDKVFELRQK